MSREKPFTISRWTVFEAWKRVKANKGAAGMDGICIEQYEQNLKENLYKLWNRMSSGSYFPKPVLGVEIPKKTGGKRMLGIPTVEDRIAQMTARLVFEPMVEKIFHEDSYGYRPNKSALDAVGKTRERCWRYDFVIELDIKGLFDNIDHELLIKGLRYYTDKKHILLYCERWLKAPVQLRDGTLKPNQGKGTPQGGVISPILANIFLDIVFDKWIEKHYPDVVFERYADDIVVHCQHIKQALRLLEAIKQRLKDCKLELNREKCKIVYCRRNQKKQPLFKVHYQKFDFLGFTFKPRITKMHGKLKLGFTPAMSQKNIARITDEIFKRKIHRWVHFSLSKIAELINSQIRGWINYYSKFRKSEMRKLFRVINMRLVKWVRNKYRKFRRRHWYNAYKYLKGIAQCYPNLFVHWQHGFLP